MTELLGIAMMDSNVTSGFGETRALVLSMLSGASGGASEDSSRKHSTEERLVSRLALFTVLVRETLRFCEEQVPAAREMFHSSGASTKGFSTLHDLEAFPILDRSVLAAAPRGFVATGVDVWGMKSTSGTTTPDAAKKAGRFSARFCIPYTREEMEFCALLDGYNSKRDDNLSTSKPLCLSLRPQSRRITPTRMLPSGGSIVIEAPFILDSPRYLTGTGDGIDYIFKLLGSKFDLPGVDDRISRLIALPAFMVRLLQEQANLRDVDLKDFGIREILCAGYQVSPAAIRGMEAAWDASVSLTYSFSETNGHALACQDDPTVFHFNQAQYIEVLDTVAMTPVAVGDEGWLATTTLFPFQIAMPLVRYLNGDLVQRCPHTCQCGFVGQSVRFVGRKGQFLELEGTQPGRRFLGAADVVAAIDKVGGIPQEIHYKFLLARDPVPNQTYRVIVEGPIATFEKLTAKAALLREELLLTDPIWHQRAEAGELKLEVEVVPTGGLTNYMFLGT